MAHDNMRLANIYVNSGDLLDANLNRSPYAYDNNPPEEIDRYRTHTRVLCLVWFVQL